MSTVKILKPFENEIARATVNSIIHDFNLNRTEYSNEPWNCNTRIRNCKAWAETHINNEKTIICLYSYHTLVAIYIPSLNICYDILRYIYGYTATSTQHIWKFIGDYCNDNTIIYRVF